MPARPRPFSSSRTLHPLIPLAQALSQSGSALEDRYWRERLCACLDKILTARANQRVEAALTTLLEQHSEGYEALVELAEARSESIRLSHQGAHWDALLISAPVLAWTRYQLPEGRLQPTQHQALSALMHTHVLADAVQLHLMPELIRFDHLPQSFQETRKWTSGLAQCALGRRRTVPKAHKADVPDDLLADAYFLVGVIAAPEGNALFQWQNEDPRSSRERITQQWSKECADILGPSFTGCQMEYLLPNAFYASTRQADQHIRPLTIKAAVAWLHTAGRIAPSELRAAIVSCGDHNVEEYRVGFCTRQSNDVIYGCVWPSLNREEYSPEAVSEGQVDPWDTIAALLREAGVQDIRRLPGMQALEFCEDCGTPYFPNMLGEMQHPELPDEVSPQPVQLH